ncbi:MAG: AAA family ATPase [Bradymonadales bacterium]
MMTKRGEKKGLGGNSGDWSGFEEIVVDDFLGFEEGERNEVRFVQRTMADIVENVRREKSGVGPMPKASPVDLERAATINKLYYPAKLNNLSVGDLKQGLAPFEIETIALEGRDWGCRQLTGRFGRAIEERRKFACFVVAASGMGKTTFLGDIYTLLDKRFTDLLILSPNSSNARAFATMVELLEQRFYLTAGMSHSLRMHHLWGALESILPDVDEAKAIAVKLGGMFERYVEGEAEADLEPSDEEIEGYVDALLSIWKADLLKNRVVLIFDDVEKMDQASLKLIARLYVELQDEALGIVFSASEDYVWPEYIKRCEPLVYQLPSLSDAELERFSYYLLQQLLGNREKLVIPLDLCKLIAQKSFGSPRRAQEITAKFFHPADFLNWNESIERVKALRAPDNFEAEFGKKLERLSAEERHCLLLAAAIEQRFSADTLEFLATDVQEPQMLSRDKWGIGRGQRRFSEALRALREKGFLIVRRDALWRGPREYSFKREAERVLLTRVVDDDEKVRVHLACAKWFSLHNNDGSFNEAIAEYWRRGGNARLASQYYQAAADSARLGGAFPKAILLYKKSILTLSSEAPSLLIAMHLNLAWCSHKLGNVEDAYRHNHYAFHTALRHHAYATASHAMAQAAHVLLDLGAYKSARNLFGRARALLNREYNPLVAAVVIEGFARYQYLKHDLAQAEKSIENAFQIRRCQSPALEITPTLHLQSLIALANNDLALALDLQQQCLELRHERKDIIGVGESYRVLALIHYKSENTAKALDLWNKALGIAQEVGDVALLAQLLIEIAAAAININALKTAQGALSQSMGLAKKSKNKALICICLRTQAELLLVKKQYDKAYHCMRKSLRVARKLGNYQLIADNLSLFAQLFSMDSQEHHSIPKAERYFSSVIKLLEKKNLRIDLAKLLPIYAEFHLQNKQNILALNLYKRARDIYKDLQIEKTAEAYHKIIEQLEGSRVGSGSVV